MNFNDMLDKNEPSNHIDYFGLMKNQEDDKVKQHEEFEEDKEIIKSDNSDHERKGLDLEEEAEKVKKNLDQDNNKLLNDLKDESNLSQNHSNHEDHSENSESDF